MKLDLFRSGDGALIVVPSRFSHALPDGRALRLRYVRTVEMRLSLLGDELIADIGLHGFGVARGPDAALLRSCSHAPVSGGSVPLYF